MPPYLNAVNNILPQNVAAWPHCRQWIQVSIGYPDSKSSVLLPQGLARINRTTEEMTNISTNDKLYQAKY